VVVDTPQVVAVERRKRSVERQDLEAVLRQRELRTISGRSSETTYDATLKRKPGNTSSVTAAPPRTWRRSSTTTLSPARARYAAATSPLCPPPTITAS
jgi:hypothetical protein